VATVVVVGALASRRPRSLTLVIPAGSPRPEAVVVSTALVTALGTRVTTMSAAV